jgi:hypothetical protein
MSVTLAEKAPTSTLDPRFHIEAAERRAEQHPARLEQLIVTVE